ncbi:MAG: heme-copper oxidase subunit III [Polyangiaceae bacterium]
MAGSVVKLEPRMKEDFTRTLGMIIALGAWAMMFGALFFVYAGIRTGTRVWPPPGLPPIPVALPAVNTLVLAASSGALVFGTRGLAAGRRKPLALWLFGAFVLGGLFLGLQCKVWSDLYNGGLLPSSGQFASVFYGLTVLHAAHVAAGLIVLAVMFVRALRGEYTEHNVGRVRVAGMFWHFVDIVWVLMFVSLYLI